MMLATMAPNDTTSRTLCRRIIAPVVSENSSELRLPSPLMVPLPVVMRHELVDRADQVPFPEQDQLVQTLLANRPHEPFRVSVGVRSLDRSPDDTHSRLIEEPSKFLRPLAVSVADQHLMAG